MHPFLPRGLFFNFGDQVFVYCPGNSQTRSSSPPEPPCGLEVQTDAFVPGIVHFLKIQTGLNLVAADTGASIREFL